MMPEDGKFCGFGMRELDFSSVLSRQAERFGDKVYLHYLPDGRKISFREADLLTRKIASGLKVLNVGRGTRVAVLMENSPECLLLHFALGRLGAIGAAINAGARGALLKHFLSLCAPSVLVIDEALLPHYLAIQTDATTVQDVVVLGSDNGETTSAARMHGWNDISSVQAVDLEPVRFDMPVHILFTSGTTGPSKAILYVQARSLLYGVDHGGEAGFTADDVLYGWNPLFHVSGLQCVAIAALLHGTTVVMPKRFSVSRFWDEIRETGCTMAMLSGQTISMMWAQPPAGGDRDHRLRLVMTSPIPQFADGFMQRFNVAALAGGYGLSDCGLVCTLNTGAAPEKRFSDGRPLPYWDMRILDGDDFPLPAGETGEIALRCNRAWSTASGYFGNDAATVAAWRNGWFHTGDLGYLDADGYLWFVGRKKDSIRRRGENISAFEVELAIAANPAVAEAAAFPLSSELGDEEVAVCVVLKPGAELTAPGLLEFARANMTKYMVPRYIRFVPDLPKTLNLKVEKYRLRQEAEADRGAYWDSARA
jgi:crotonobetaine/carnitine-CoA ligase